MDKYKSLKNQLDKIKDAAESRTNFLYPDNIIRKTIISVYPEYRADVYVVNNKGFEKRISYTERQLLRG